MLSMCIYQISLQPYQVGTIIISIFINEETEAQGLSHLPSSHSWKMVEL